MMQKAGQGDKKNFILTEKCENFLLANSPYPISLPSAQMESGQLPIHFN